MSLFISKQSGPAQTSMSPALKTAVPVGSLEARVLPEKTVSTAQRRRLALTSQGWRSESFKSASQKLSAAASRLRTEADRESKYWDQVTELKTRGWPVSRLPRDSEAIGAHFGFAESAPQFRDRGFALLRQGIDGKIWLDRHASLSRTAKLEISIYRKGQRTGYFAPAYPTGADTATISEEIAEARNALFEEELFYEVCRETRIAANQGITARAQAVEVDISGEYQISLALSDSKTPARASGGEDDHLAEFVALSLRLLLRGAHERNLFRRSQRPPALSHRPATTHEYVLLRPIVAQLRHKASIAHFEHHCGLFIASLRKAGLQVTLARTGRGRENHPLDIADTTLFFLMHPAQTTFELHLVSGRTLQIDITTYLGPPLHGTRYESSPLDFGFASMPIATHDTDWRALASIRHVLTLDLVAHVEGLAAECGKAMAGQEWHISQPHNGELSMHHLGQIARKVQLSVLPHAVDIKAIDCGRNNVPSRKAWLWTTDGSWELSDKGERVENPLPFDEVVRRLLRRPD